MLIYLFIVSLSISVLLTIKKRHLFFIFVSVSSLLSFLNSAIGLLEKNEVFPYRLLLAIFSEVLLLVAWLAVVYFERKNRKGIVFVLGICALISSIIQLVLMTFWYCVEGLLDEKIISYVFTNYYLLEFLIFGLTIGIIFIMRNKLEKAKDNFIITNKKN